MAPPILRKILGPRGVHRFDPARPLYVRRRISLGPDDTGAMRWMEPGDAFPSDRVKPMRVAALFASRHIAHEKPGHGVDHRGRPIVSSAVTEPTPAEDLNGEEAAPAVTSDPAPATPPTEAPKPRRGRG